MGSRHSKAKKTKKHDTEEGILRTQKKIVNMVATPPKTVRFDEDSIVKTLQKLGKNVEGPKATKESNAPTKETQNIQEISDDNVSNTSKNLRKEHYREYEVVDLARRLIELDLKAMGDDVANDAHGTTYNDDVAYDTAIEFTDCEITGNKIIGKSITVTGIEKQDQSEEGTYIKLDKEPGEELFSENSVA